jgi:1-acyl-sn-glycerol-3-phosphate acyltransferase
LKIRGTVTLLAIGLGLAVSDLIQRTFIAGLVHLAPSRRDRILAAWQQGMATMVLGITTWSGGARFGAVPTLPAREGVLVLMNHQSVLDIPLVVRALRGGYPRIVTRERYAHGKPLISHMIRLYQYPTVDPGATVRRHVLDLAEAARASHVPLVLFPEGTRTRTGAIGAFRRAGLRAVLGARPWEVWIMVADGTWQSARLVDFLGNVSSIRARATAVGPFRWEDPTDDPDAFIHELRDHMIAALEGLRSSDGSS